VEFANPAMLFGTLLFTVPLIIHLLNRRRYRVKRWAAMSFLLAAYKRTRKKLRFENFLLLLLRCLIIILLALAMAKPFVSSESAAAALSSIRRDVVIVLDNSYSMGYRLNTDVTCFDLARQKITHLLSRLDAARGDTATMILMGRRSEFFAPLQSSPDDVLVKLDRLKEPAPEGADFSALMDLLVGEVAVGIEGRKEVYIFTDLQACTLGAGGEGSREATAKLLERAAELDTTIQFVDVGKSSPWPPNRVVTDVGTLEDYVTTDAPTTFVAEVRNFSEHEIPDCRGAFLLDGKSVDAKSLSLKPSSSTAVECTLIIEEPGFHTVSFRIDRDDLPIDDERWFAFEARQQVNVLLVDGRPHEDPDFSATAELARVINPVWMEGSGDRGCVFEPEIVDYKLFNAGRVDLAGYDCIVFVDVEGLSREMTQALTDYTAGGGSVVFFLGDQVDLAAYNQRLLAGEGPHLLPVRLEEVMGEAADARSVDYYRLIVIETRHPIFALFDDPRYKMLLDVPVFRFIKVAEPEEEAKVVARLVDPLERSHPAVIEKRVGQGKVVVFTFSTSPEWSLLPESPVTFLPLVHNLLYYLTARDTSTHNLTVGETIRRSMPEFPETIALTDPAGYREVINEPVERREHGRYLLPLANRPLEEPGPYFLEVEVSLSGRSAAEFYAANVTAGEGNMKRFDSEGLATLFPGAEAAIVDSAVLDSDAGDAEGGKGEFWQTLLMALLALVGLELILSWKFGNYA
jgi:hypothetical protein